MDSILNSIKKRLGIFQEYDNFDDDIIMDINSVFSILSQLGVGPSSGYFIKNQDDEWTDFMPCSRKLEFVKSYIYLKVKMLFDPPQSSFVIESMNNQIKELEWRIVSQIENN